MRTTRTWTVPIAAGETHAIFERAEGPPIGDTTLVLAHGAGSNMNHRATTGPAEALRARGLHVVRFDFSYRALGKGRPDPMPKLQACYAAVVETVRREIDPPRLLLGGRSLGGRTASMLVAGGLACDGLVLLAYPLHQPGRTDRLRDAHLPSIAVPTLCLNGTRDNLCDRAVMDRVAAGLPDSFTLHWIDGADHGFHVLKRSGRTDEDVLEEVADVTARWAAAPARARASAGGGRGPGRG